MTALGGIIVHGTTVVFPSRNGRRVEPGGGAHADAHAIVDGNVPGQAEGGSFCAAASVSQRFHGSGLQECGK